jgi:membrane peptidoglycan carboxypeptidase
MRNGRPWDDGADERYASGDYAALESHGVLRSTIDYDLGYEANGWDTQGFRRPEAGDLDSRAVGDLDSRPIGDVDSRAAGDLAGNGARPAPSQGNGHAGSHARASELRTGDPLGREPGPYGSTGSWAPDWPGGPGHRGGPEAFRDPGRQARDRSATKVARAKVKGSWWRHWTVRKALGVLLGGIGAFIVLAAIAVAVAYEKTPVPSEAMAATSYVQSVVYSSNGTLIGRFGTTNRQMLSYDQIPKGIVNAVLAAEDRHFWTEGGVSPDGILRAAYEDVTGSDGSVQGGSTITQQFVRNYYQGVGTQQTLSRKIKEIFVAMKVAKEKSKQWILANYLNTIYLGEGAYGIQAAAETYFDKPVAQLSVAQDAVIAAMIQQPSTYPLPQYRPELMARWQYVITGMVRTGTLSAQDAAKAKFPKLGDYVPQTFGKDVWDPYVLNVVKNELTQVYHFSETQLDDGGYTIRTTIDDAKMAALYQAVQQNEVAMAQGGVPLPYYAQVGAVLENPANGAIQAMYPGPGYPGSKYVDHEGGTHKMTARECAILHCEVNMAVYNREQVGSSFKPYVLATAVSQGMNVQTSTLDGFDPLYIPPATDTGPNVYATSDPADAGYQWHRVLNDDASENQPYTPQMAMAASINTAYADLWQRAGAANVANMAKLFGVDTAEACITESCGSSKDNDYVPAMVDEVGVALGQASLTVAEQATMLATIDDGGIYHDAHVIASITSLGGVATPVKITSYPVFDPGSSALNAEEATQVQYAMSEDTASFGTAPAAAMSNGQEIIAKTGTTTNYTSAFFIGAIPTQALAVGIFTDHPEDQSLPSDLGGNSQGGYGGTWPTAIWHTYAENMFVPLGVEQFQPVVFTGQVWNLVPPNLRVAPKPHKNHHGHGPPGQPGGYPSPLPTSSCDPQLVACPPGVPVTPTPLGAGNTQTATSTASATAAPPATGAAAGGIFAALPATCLWVRRRTRKRGPKRG